RSHSSHSKNSHSGKSGKSNSKSGKNGKNSHANKGNHSNHRGGRGGWDGGGWDGGGWDAGDVIPVIPVDPGVVVPRPVVITLLNPAITRTSLSYTLGESQYVIAAGETATFEDGTQVIAFDRGGSFGEARYTLEPGRTYKFVATDHGWDLHSVTSDTEMADADTSKSAGVSALSLVSED
ncbi:MAG TPA: hypothetical protein VEI07_25120, partial [Planctomycetaceae bacterium]|nr:hypothetical protein [Planctomycetaceae bacterium]